MNELKLTLSLSVKSIVLLMMISIYFIALVHPDNQLSAFLNYSGVDAWRVIEIQGHGEYLLVFQTLAIYVDLQGRKSRDREIMYPALPTHISMFSFDI